MFKIEYKYPVELKELEIGTVFISKFLEDAKILGIDLNPNVFDNVIKFKPNKLSSVNVPYEIALLHKNFKYNKILCVKPTVWEKHEYLYSCCNIIRIIENSKPYFYVDVDMDKFLNMMLKRINGNGSENHCYFEDIHQNSIQVIEPKTEVEKVIEPKTEVEKVIEPKTEVEKVNKKSLFNWFKNII